MGLHKGQCNNLKGRPKGSQNKVTAETKELLSKFINKKVKELEGLWKKLEPKDKAIFLAKIIDFDLPKMKAVELTSDFELLNDTQLNVLIEEITQKILENNDNK